MAEEEATAAQPQPPIPPASSSSSDPPPAMGSSSLDDDSLRNTPHRFPSSDTEPVQNQELNSRGQGLYAVHYPPYKGMMVMMPDCTPSLIPLYYTIPARTNLTGAIGAVQGGGVHGQPQGAQRVHVRRVQLAFQLDLGLFLKLSFAVALFGQNGSRQRQIVLVFLATFIYLYQTGVLTPLMQYIRRRGLTPPRPVARGQNAAIRRNIEDNAAVENQNQNQYVEADQPAEANEPAEPDRANFGRLLREIKTFVVGFIFSLLPGFEQRND